MHNFLFAIIPTNMESKTKAERIGLIILITFVFLDIFTTALVSLRGGIGLEINPLVSFNKFFPIMIIAHILVIFAFWFYLTRKSPLIFFLTLSFISFSSLVRLYSIISATQLLLKPKAIEIAINQTAHITRAAKTLRFGSISIFYYLIPVAITVIIYFLFRMKYKIVEK